MAEHHHAHDHDHHADKEPGGHTAKDPVCGMAVDPHTAEHRSQHGGKTWYFCSSRCQSKFDEDPEQYLDWEKKQQEPVAPGTMYTCPMHPEIRQQGPGDCPICGMALEPEQVSLDDGPSEELKDMTRRFWIGLVLALPVLVLEMGGHLTGLDHIIAPQMSNWIQLVLATPVVLWCGWPFFVRGWKSVVSRNLNMFTLIAIGTGVALIYSLVATLAPQIFPGAFRQEDGSVAVYFEAAAVIVVLVLLGLVNLRGDGESAAEHTKFYDEYLAVMDMTAEFYLETIEVVFQTHALPEGKMLYRGDRPVRPEATFVNARLSLTGNSRASALAARSAGI